MANLSPLLDALVDAVRTTGSDALMPPFLAARASATRKPDGSLLTPADTAVQAALIPRLRAIADHPVVGEEMSESEQRAAWARGGDGLWIVDPIDGTTNFVQGLPYFAISAALWRDGRPRAGVVYNPVLDEMFAAEAGRGATLNGRPLALGVAGVAMSRAVAAVEAKYLPRRLAAALVAEPPFHSQRNWGAGALDWCYLAAGRFDLYVHGGQRLWDYAAGLLVFAEAGGTYASLESDDFWSPPPWSRSIIAARDAAVFAEWRDWVRLHLRAP